MLKIGSVAHYVQNDNVEYRDETYQVNNGGVIESRTRRVRVDNKSTDREFPFMIVKIGQLEDKTPVYSGWIFGEDDSRYVNNVLQGNPSTPGTIHEVD